MRSQAIALIAVPGNRQKMFSLVDACQASNQSHKDFCAHVNLHSAVGVDANTCVETGVKAAQGISAE